MVVERGGKWGGGREREEGGVAVERGCSRPAIEATYHGCQERPFLT